MIKSGYSFKTAVGHLSDVLARIEEVGLEAAPLADRASAFGHVKWAKLTKSKNIKPIFGVELAVTPSAHTDRPIVDYWTFLAKKNLRSIYELVADATVATGTPKLTYKKALAAEGVIKIAGYQVQLDHFDPDAPDVYLALSPAIPNGLLKTAVTRGIKLVSSCVNRYPKKSDREFYRVTLGKFADTQTYPQHILNYDEWRSALPFSVSEESIDSSIANRAKIFAECDAELKLASMLVPEKPRTLLEMCQEGARKLDINLNDPRYAQRLERELALIKEKSFEDYFYILADIVNWARERMIVGPARGSSCGSLACYLLGITTVDPLKYDLLFERFIAVNRDDLPDIDVDFSQERREMLFEYVRNKYGRERVARLGTVGTLQVRAAMNRVGISLRIPKYEIENVASKAIVRSLGDARASATIEDTFNDTEVGRKFIKNYPEARIATLLEDHPANAGQHAAGIVITADEVLNTVAVDSRTGAAQCDKYDAEDINLLKIDALGLTQLTIFERTAELIGKPSKSGWLEKLPLNDPASFKILNDRKFTGIFQFAGHAMRSVAEGVKFTQFEDIVAITALARPGPLAAGGTQAWIERKAGHAPVVYQHPLIEPYTKDTLGVVAYQEQILQISREIGDLSWGDVTELRKAMSRSLGREFFDRYGDRFKPAAIAKGMPSDIANRVWDDMCGFGSWAFNKSHAVAYAYVSYWCCYLKAHYPVEFAAATLDSENDPARQLEMLREMAEEGINYVPVDSERSIDKWTVTEKDGKKVLVGPVSNIKGIGPVSVMEIIDARKTGALLKKTTSDKLKNAKTPIDSLYPLRDRLQKLCPEIINSRKILPIRQIQPGIAGEVFLIGVAIRITNRDMNDLQAVAKRGGKRYDGPTMTLNMFMRDDDGEIICKVDRWLYRQIDEHSGMPFGQMIFEKTNIGKSIWGIAGTMPRDFRMMWINRVRYIGELEDDLVSLVEAASED